MPLTGPNQTSWKKGQSGNPKGRGKKPPEVLEAKRINKAELDAVFNRFLQYPVKELEKYKDNGEAKTIEAILASILTYAIKRGDPVRFNFILDRLVGRVKERIDVDFQSQNMHIHASLQQMPTDQLVSLVRQSLDQHNGAGVIEGLVSNEDHGRPPN